MATPSPGKRTLVEQSDATAPVQRQASPAATVAPDAAGVHAAAARGTATPASALPHGDLIQRAFGRHDISSVRAHVGGEAAASAGAMGAQAYATGNHVVLGQGADLFTEAHEAAHVVQQRGGVQLKGGVGETSDAHEQQADAVASLVVQGKSAEGQLDRIAAPSSAVTPTASAQHQVQRQPTPTPSSGAQTIADLQRTLDESRWRESVRPRLYKQASAPGLQRAQDRRKGGTGAPADLTGIGSISSIDHFVGEVKAVQTSWAATKPDQRAHKLFDAANVELDKAKVPKMKSVGVPSPPITPRGQFTSSTWHIDFQETLIKNNSLSNDDAADLCNVTLHEARHAEQAWLAARWDASQGKLAADIVTRLDIHGDIAIKAVHDQLARQKAKTPWDSPDQEKLAHTMFDADVTNGDANNKAEIAAGGAIAKLQADHVDGALKLAALKANATAQAIADANAAIATLRQDVKDVEVAYAGYRAVPAEADAHEVGDSAELAFRNPPSP